jgi:hypothetical protein
MHQDYYDLIVAWGPFLLILVVFVIYARFGGMHARAPSGRTMIELYELLLEETKRHTVALQRNELLLEEAKRHTAALERIAQALEKRTGS